MTLYHQNWNIENKQFITLREALGKGPLKVEMTITLFHQIMSALFILHKYDLIVNQLNDEAILLSLDDNGSVCMKNYDIIILLHYIDSNKDDIIA